MSAISLNVDLCVIGAGSGGLSVAAGAAQLGRRVVLFEAAEMGGDCLNYGCVPSKSLISAAHIAHSRGDGADMGIMPAKPKVDFKAVKNHIQQVIDTIAPHDSQQRFEKLGCRVIREKARFKDARTVISDNALVTARRIIIATGSRASVPPIPGLDMVAFLTNETIFNVESLPEHLLILGAGPIGLEIGQSFRRLGSRVSIIDIAAPLSGYEPAMANMLIETLKSDGIDFYAPAQTQMIKQNGKTIIACLDQGIELEGSHLLVATGRKPTIDALDLDKANIAYDRSGIITDDNLRTSNKRVFAIGDCAAGRGGLTHIAGYHAGQIIKQFYFLPPPIGRWLSRVRTDHIAAAIYTKPELATIGLNEAKARIKHKNIKVLGFDFNGNDRALAEGDTQGSVKIIASSKGKVLGATIIGNNAGDMIQILSLAMSADLKISQIAQFISPYPTRSEAVKRAASSFYTDAVFGPKAKKLAGLLTRFH